MYRYREMLNLTLADSSTCDKSKKEREERIRMMRERQEKEHERRISELRAAQEREAQLRRANDLERERRIKELRERETSRRHLVEERRKILEQQELERRKQIMAKYQKDKSATAPRSQRPAYAFGSSTPRTLAYLESLNREMKVYNARLQSAQAATARNGDANNSMSTSFSTPKKAVSTANLVRRPFSAKAANNRMSTSIHVTNTSHSQSASAHPPRRPERSSPKGTGGNLLSARMTQSVITVHSTPTDSKTALNERRRLAREQADKERELQKQREQMRLEEEERIRQVEERKRLEEEEREKAEEEERLRREEEEFRRREEEELRAIEEMKRAEEERLRQAIEEERKRREEEDRKAEEARKRQLEAEMKLREHNERLEREKRETEERLRREEEERSERRKKLDAIMKRTRNSAPKPLNSSATEINNTDNSNGQNSTGPIILENGISHSSAAHFTSNNGPITTFRNNSEQQQCTDFRLQSPNEVNNGSARNHVTSPPGNHVTSSGMAYSSSSAALLQKYANSKSEIGRSVENILAKVRSSTPTNRLPPQQPQPSTMIGSSAVGSAHRGFGIDSASSSPLAKSATASDLLDGGVDDEYNYSRPNSNLSTPTTASSNQDDARDAVQSQHRKSVVDQQIDLSLNNDERQYGRPFDRVTRPGGSKIVGITDQLTQYDVDVQSAASVSQYASIVLNNGGDADRRNHRPDSNTTTTWDNN